MIIKQSQTLEDSKNNILGASEDPLDQSRGSLSRVAWSSGLQQATGSIRFVRSTYPGARSIERPSQAIFRRHSNSFVRPSIIEHIFHFFIKIHNSHV